jgi:hypothetical protein|tara:strand:- start:108 stop:920 length:813 start_codon:yes stop_codon:yes gene_type:complete
MRFVFFIINSAIFILYCVLIFSYLGGLIPLTREINESQLYAQTLITIEFVDTVFIATLWSFLFSIVIALIIGVYSRKPTDKLDRKILFSKKGFLVNTSLVVTLFMVDISTSDFDVYADDKFKKKEVEAIHTLYKTEKTTLLPLISNETPASFSRRLNDSKGKEFNQLLEIRYLDECRGDFLDEVNLRYNSFEFLMVPNEEFNETISFFNRSYKKDGNRCARLKQREIDKLEEMKNARLKSQRETNREEIKRQRELADDLCNIVNGTRNGC